jgi:hypothetical protein
LARDQDLSANFFFVYPDNGITFYLWTSAHGLVIEGGKGKWAYQAAELLSISAGFLLFTLHLPKNLLYIAFILASHPEQHDIISSSPDVVLQEDVLDLPVYPQP